MRRPFLPVLLLLALIPACAPLETLTEGACGNGVIDTVDEGGVLQGEDCDGLKIDGFECIGPGEAWQCSFKCSSEGACPTGYGCGTDSVCRRATGVFEGFAFTDGPSQALELLPGDFDADGITDIVGIEPGRVRINFASETGSIQQVFLPVLGRPTIGRLGALSKPTDGDEKDIDKTDDLMIALDIGLGALTSNGDRTFAPKTYASITFGGLPNTPDGKEVAAQMAVPMAFDALPDPTLHPGDETAALFSLLVGGELLQDGAFATFSTGGSGLVFGVKDTRPDNMTGPPVTANFDSDPCQEVVFPHYPTDGDPSVGSKISVYKACVPGKNQGEWEWRNEKSPPGTEVVVDIDVGGVVVGPGYAYDVNADGSQDLLLTVISTDLGFQLNVAYSLGNGTFCSTDPTAGPVLADNKAGFYATLDDLPLAFGRLNDDAYLDIVQTTKVQFGSPAGPGQLAFGDSFSPKRTWNEALIADVNADGRPDVVACTNGAADLDLYTNTGGAVWNPSTISTDGTVANLHKGDFDGDLVTDIVFQDYVSSDESLLMIAYGRGSGGPEEPVEIGNFPDILSISTGNVRSFGVDSITDLGVVSNVGGALSLSFFPGAGNRVMQTPYLLADKENQVHVPLQTGIGFLRPWDGADEAHKDVVALAFKPSQGPEGEKKQEKLERFRSSMHLWGLFGAGEAAFSALETANCPLPHGAFFLPPIREASSVVLTDVPLGGASEVLIATPYIELSKGGVSSLDVSSLLSPATFDPGGGSCQMMKDKPLRTDPGQLLFRVRSVDLNGNGTPEILAILGDYDNTYLSNLIDPPNQGDPTGAEPSAGPGIIDGQFAARLVIFWDGKLGQGEKLVPVAPDNQPDLVSDYAVGDFTGDGKPEVVVVGQSGSMIYAVSEGGDALTVSPFNGALDLAGSRAVLLADADGDGVKDMAVAAGSLLQIWRGVAKREVGKDAPADPIAAGTK